MKILITVLFLTVILCSCNSDKTTESDTDIPVTVIDVSNYKDLSEADYIDSISFIKLENLKESQFGNITKIKATGDCIYLMDADATKSIKVFDWSGKFLFALDFLGRAEGEYLALSDFTISENEEIMVLDHLQSKVLWFDKAGLFVKELKYSWNATGMESFSSGNLLFSVDNISRDTSQERFPRLIIADSTMKPLDSLLFYTGRADVFYSSSLVFNYTINSEVVYSEMLYDSVMVIDPETRRISQCFYFDFGTEAMPKSIREGTNNQKRLSEYGALTSHAFFNGNYLFGYMMRGDQPGGIFLFDVGNEMLYFHSGDFGFEHMDHPVGVFRNKVFEIVPFDFVLNEEFGSRLPEQMNLHIKSGGAVLMVYHLKQ